MRQRLTSFGIAVAVALTLGSVYLVGRLQGLNYATAHKPPTQDQTYYYLLTHSSALTDAWCRERIAQLRNR